MSFFSRRQVALIFARSYIASVLLDVDRVQQFEGDDSDSMFGHSGMGGALVVCDAEKHVAFAITVNRLTMDREFTRTVANHICQELGLGMIFEID